MNAIAEAVAAAKPLRLDFGAGMNPKEGFTAVDRRAFPKIDVVCDLLERWPWEDSSMDEGHMSHVLEHFTSLQRVHILNELWRVSKPGAKTLIITPHWASERAYGDFTHQWAPISEFLWYYVKREWRKVNAPDNDIEWNPDGYTCDFECTWGHALRQDLLVRAQDYQVFALTNFKGAATDMLATLTATKP
jgi:hypothetical protein